MSAIALSDGFKSQATWKDFFSSKGWGYWQDSLVTTHPIETEVSDVKTSMSNFDGITYAKGASALKQLHFYVGKDQFRDGVRNYFKKFAWKNTARADFISAIQDASQLDLADWTKAWLQTAGLNTVTPSWSCSNGLLSEFKIQQTKSISGALSPHRTKIGFYKSASGRMELVHTYAAAYSAEENRFPEVNGIPCPDFVYANLDDHDYANFVLDRVSLETARHSLHEIQDSLLRGMIWFSLEQMVRNAELKPIQYFDFAIEALHLETDQALLGNLLSTSYSAIRENYLAYLTVRERASVAPRLEGFLWNRMLAEKAGSSNQLSFFDFYVSIARSDSSQAHLASLLTGSLTVPGIIVDQSRRWEMIKVLAANGYASALDFVAAEELKDKTDAGEKAALEARVLVPSYASKFKAWQEYVGRSEVSRSTARIVFRAFHSPDHPEISSQFVDEYFKTVKELNWDENYHLADLYFESLFPIKICTQELLKRSQLERASAQNLNAAAKRAWLEAEDELARCVRVRTKFE
jgi:aminopeptidase N